LGCILQSGEAVKKKNGFVSFVVAGLCCVVSAPGHAASGTVDLVLTTTAKVYAVDMGEFTATASAGNGALTFIQSSGRPFDEGGGATVQFVSFSKTQPSGLDLEADGVATFSPEDTLLLLFQRRWDDPGTSGEGNMQFTGGTGRFAGISGQCRYKMDHASDGKDVTVAKCQWVYSFPYR
jgi:hypothetical protein